MTEKVVNLSVIQNQLEQEEAESLQEWLDYIGKRFKEFSDGLADGSFRGLITIGIPADETAPRIDLFGAEPLPLAVMLGYLEASKLDIAAYHMSYDDE